MHIIILAEEAVHPDDRLRYRETMKDLISGKSLTYDITYRSKIHDGTYTSFRYMGAVIRDASGNPSLVGGMVVNAGRWERIDPNTMLPNQEAFFNDLAALHLAAKHCVLLLIGITELSHINRHYSYSYGNSVLQEVAWLLQEETHNLDRFYRLSGSRFALISKTATADEVKKVYHHLRHKLGAGIAVGENRQSISLCGGLLTVNDFSRSAQAIYSWLVSVYHESKFRRDGELVVFDSCGSVEANTNLATLDLIHDSMVNDCVGFFMEYQPVVDMGSQEVLSLEALVRWTGPDGQVVYPKAFIRMLEVDLAYDELGLWILRRTMLDGMRFLKYKPNLLLGVNVVSAQISDPLFIDAISDLAAETKFPLTNLCLEVSSDSRRMTFAILSRSLEKLRNLGIRLIMDDFGTGFDFVELLEDIKWDFVKCDKMFVVDANDSKKHQAALIHLKALANIYDTVFCVKGVRSKETINFLLENNICMMQGAAIQHPIGADQIDEYLKSKKYC